MLLYLRDIEYKVLTKNEFLPAFFTFYIL